MTFADHTITAELRSVNNRYFDCSVRIPRVYLFMEEQIKSAVQKQVSRGKVDVFITIDSSHESATQISINHSMVDGYCTAIDQLSLKYNLKNDLTISKLIELPDVLHTEKVQEDTKKIGEEILQTLESALQEFEQMQRREGEKLKEDILNRKETMEKYLAFVEEKSPQSVEIYRKKLELRMAEALENIQIDPARVLAEAAIFADKIAVDEETVRLHSHLEQLDEILKIGGAVGRKLDFLIQEFNREVNTVGSKCSDMEITRCVVDMKSEIEKIREQTQNIE